MWITGTITRKAKSEAKSFSPLRGLQVVFGHPPEEQRTGSDLQSDRVGAWKLCLTFWPANTGVSIQNIIK